MSENSLKKIEDAITAHLNEDATGILVTQWVIGYETINTEDNYQTDYIAGPGSPSAAVGLARLAEASITRVLTDVDD